MVIKREVSKMNRTLIIVSSVTYALRGQGLLESSGIKARINRTKNRKTGSGCSYSISVPREKADEAVRILKNNGIRVIDRMEGTGSG